MYFNQLKENATDIAMIVMFGVKCEVVYGGVSGTAEVPQWICFDQERYWRGCAWGF